MSQMENRKVSKVAVICVMNRTRCVVLFEGVRTISVFASD